MDEVEQRMTYKVAATEHEYSTSTLYRQATAVGECSA